MSTQIQSLTCHIMPIYTGATTYASIHAHAVAAYLLIPDVSTIYCFCFAVKKFCGFIP